MSFLYSLSDSLKVKMRAISKKNPKLAEAVYKKILQIVALDEESIDHFKNLKAPLNDLKRVHLGSFALKFRVYKEQNFILFDRLDHHDDAY